MLKVIAAIVAFALALKGYIAYASNNPSLTDGQYLGYGMLLAMAGSMLVGWAWESRKR